VINAWPTGRWHGFRAMEPPHRQLWLPLEVPRAPLWLQAAKAGSDGALRLECVRPRPSMVGPLNCAASMMKSSWMWGQPSLPPESALEATAETRRIEIPPRA